MAHLLTPPPTTAATAFSARARKSPLYSWKNGYFPTTRVCCVGHQYQQSQPSSISGLDQVPPPRDHHSLRRRTLIELSGAVVLGLSLSDEQSARGAARLPPPPPREKKDPNVSGVQAKVLASKRRKEAMKEEMAKLRERGKPINIESPPPPPPPPAPE
ncbi:myosin-5 protein [Spatholobus suberectus]|nr:myosin-5 protein [Spatholobus suberectus]